MSIAKVILKPLANESDRIDQIYINEQLYHTWNLPKEQKVVIQCGLKNETVSIQPIKEDQPTVYLHPLLLKELYLPVSPLQIRLSYNPKTLELRVGPFIALLTRINTNTRNPESIFGPVTTFCDELRRFSEKNFLGFIVISLKDIHDNHVQGYIFSQGSWCKVNLPFPDVIHNRVNSRRSEQQEPFIKLRDLLTQLEIPFFNDHFLNKWEVFEGLSSYPELIPYLPNTLLLDGRGSLEEMSKQYPSVFIKPVHGSQGRQIYRVERIEEGFSLDYSTFNGEQTKIYSNLNDLYNSLRNRLKSQRFILQEGLSLVSYKQSIVDFRILCHRSVNDHWKVTSGVARLSKDNQFVSNLARGGKLRKISDLLSEVYENKKASELKKAMYELAIEVCTNLSRNCEGLYGELGVDLAIDNNEQIWLIEVNTKPSKDQEHEQKTQIRPSAKALLNYSTFLADFD